MKTSLKKFLIISTIINFLFLLIQIGISIMLVLLKSQFKLANSDISQIYFGFLVFVILGMYISHYILIRQPIRKLIMLSKFEKWQEQIGIKMMEQHSIIDTEQSGYKWYLKRKGFILLATISMNFIYAFAFAIVFSILGG